MKARIRATLKWQGFPQTGKEFEAFSSFRTHRLDVLLRLTGREQQIRSNLMKEWSAVATWGPDVRYKPIGSASKAEIELMLESAGALLNAL